jgi:hypothetical protein
MDDKLKLWENRWTVRDFTNEIPDQEKIDYLCKVIKYIPAQLGAVDHIWCLLTPEDQELKDWLVDNCYFTLDKNYNHKEYFTAIKTAPYVFHSFKLVYPGMVLESEHNRNNAFHAGVLVSEALNLGLDVAQLVCIDGYSRADKAYQGFKDDPNMMLRVQDIFYKSSLNKELTEEEKDIRDMTVVPKVYKDKIWDRFGKNIKKIVHNGIEGSIENIGHPCMCVCVGKGKPNTVANYTKYRDGVSFTGQKSSKWFHNIIK